ncbi:MAG: hypothetical protein CMJ32_02290 [Phycisphaerae bacterium]|nr:hypothetical protein [Phycisphaerae bacterium]
MPGRFSPRVYRVMASFAGRYLRKRIHGVWMVPGGTEIIRALDDHDGPAICAMNHSSWWDPIVGLYLHSRFTPSRVPCSPMDSAELVKFGFFRKAGIFGIDPDNPSSLEAMSHWVDRRFAEDVRPTLWITPQGQFTDVRQPVRPRPGIATIAAAHPDAPVIGVAIEYTFWTDSKPEICIRATRVPCPDQPSRTSWHRQITQAMQENQDALSAIVQKRDPSLLEPLAGVAAARVHPVYDFWLRLRGRKADLDVTHRDGATR